MHTCRIPALATLIGLTGVVLASAAIQQEMANRTADERAIRAASMECSKAAGARDLDKVLSFYAEDALLLARDAPVVTEKNKIRELWSQMMANPGYALSWQPIKVEVSRSADLAYEVGTAELTQTDTAGNPNSIRAKYLLIWKKQADGRWKVAVDMDNVTK